MQFRSRSSLGRRPGFVIWLVLTLFLQGLVATHHATAMASGVEVCSASGGTHRVDADGRPAAADASHDCCCPGLGAALASDAPGMPVVAPATAVVAGHAPSERCAERLAPRSRGPPERS